MLVLTACHVNRGKNISSPIDEFIDQVHATEQHVDTVPQVAEDTVPPVVAPVASPAPAPAPAPKKIATTPQKVDTVQPVVDTVPQVVDTIPQIIDTVPPVILPEEQDTNPDDGDTIPAIEVDTLTETVDTIPEPVALETTKKKPVVALRTNLLYDAVVLPNIGIEVALPKNFTLAADWFGTWISSRKRDLFWQSYGGYLTLRYYFGKAAEETPFIGHHVGIYGTALTYDIEFGGKGYQSAQFGFGGGIEYGYSLPVGHSLSIDFNIGLGFQGGKYKVYQPSNDGTGHYVWLSTHRRRWWGPTKAEISLKWLISPVEKKQKGGDE